ncbi:hypothetical protein [Smaragdicoccus niigatensis]|uniref:hypothetical protein n=1 Tax=Smaragdicoccus niigatensis TaxID=359359 RepID=UPI0012DE0B31|nr:hypothetical protein [Smaragdicoccus niigatensis]
MREAQLGMFDASCAEWGTRGRPTDYILWWAFDADGSTTVEEIIDHLKTRIQASDVLNRRLRHVPGKLDYPYWVRGVENVDAAFSVHPQAVAWSECVDEMLAILDEPLDLTVVPWAFRIFPRVDGVTGTDRPCVVVAKYMSHTIFAGSATGPLGEYFWSPELHELTIPGLPTATSKFNPVWAVVRSVRAVRQTAEGILNVVTGAVRGGAKPPAETPEPWIGRDYWSQGPRRIDAVTVPIPRGTAFTVTQMWVNAIPRALIRFHDDPAFGKLQVNVPVLVPFEDKMGANNVITALIDVDTEGSETEQLARVRDQLKSRAASVMGDEGARRAAGGARIPHYALLQAMTSVGQYSLPDAVLTSMRFSPQSTWQMGDREFQVAGTITSKFLGALVHSVWTAGDQMTVTVSASPRDVEDLRRYTKLLAEEFVALAAATPKR